jgi:L,D-transpeptidase ErfK/SrfK
MSHTSYSRFAGLLVVSALLSLFFCHHAASDESLSLSRQIVGGEFTYEVQKGDSLTSVSARFGVGINFLAASNGLKPNSFLREGQQLQVNNRHIVPNFLDDGILINLPQRMLFYRSREGQRLQAYPVGLGRPDWPTPTGSFTVISKVENPVWNVPKSIQEEMRREGKVVEEQVIPSPENPLGKHWMGLTLRGYGIHGTIAPASIYQFRSHGCIRLHPDDMAALFTEAAKGTAGRIIYQPLMVAVVGEQVFLEVHRDAYRQQGNPLDILEGIVKTNNLDTLLDWELARAIIARQEGVAREATKISTATY